MLCERMGWTLEYVSDMDAVQRQRVIVMLDALDRGRTFRNRPK